MRGHSSIWRNWVKPFLDIAQVVGVFLAAIGLFYTAEQLHQSRNLTSAEIGLRFDDRIIQPDMLGIADAIEAKPPLPILIANHGKYTEDQLDEFLGNYDTLYYLHEQELINDQMVYDLFCTDIEFAYENVEITQYLKRDRASQRSATDYLGFDKLANICLSWEKSGEGKRLED